jgi:peptide/nickel transport system permease protein
MEGTKNLISLSSSNNISPTRLAWRKLTSNKLSLFGLFVIGAFLLIAVLGPLIRPDSSPKANSQYVELARKAPGFTVEMLKLKTDSETSFLRGWLYGFEEEYKSIPIYSHSVIGELIEIEKFTGNIPNEGQIVHIPLEDLVSKNVEQSIYKEYFWLGTDRYGRDMLSRLMAGTWISFTVGFISIFLSLVIGISLGATAGYYRGKFDDFVMWFINVMWSIPTLLLVIAITLALGKGFWQVFVAVGLTIWVEVARVVRGQVIGLREMEYIEAGKALGFKDYRIIWKHIIPNITGPVIVISAANFAAAILIEAGLSFLGLGAMPPQATWGKMISEHKGYISTGDAYLAIFPGIAIFLLVLSFVLLGNGLRDAFDTKGVKNLNL